MASISTPLLMLLVALVSLSGSSATQVTNGTLFVLIDDQPPKLQVMAVNTTNGLTEHYYDLFNYSAIPPHPSTVNKQAGIYYMIVEAQRGTLALLAVDVRHSGRVVGSIPYIEQAVWGLQWDAARHQLLAAYSNALHTYCGLVDISAGTITPKASFYTNDMAFAVSHTFNPVTNEYWMVMRGRSNNTNYLLKQNPGTGEAALQKIPDDWFIADLEFDTSTQRVVGIATQINATALQRCSDGSAVLYGAAGGGGACAARNGARATTTTAQSHSFYGVLSGDAQFKPMAALSTDYILDAFSCAIDEHDGLFFAFGAHAYDKSPRDGWNVVLSLDLHTGALLRASDNPKNGHGFSVVAGAWGLQYVPNLVSPCCDDDA